MKKYWGKIGLLGIFLLMVSATFAQKIEIRRLNGGEPIVSLASFRQAGYPEKEGENINGPCLIRLPDWLPREKRADKRANYYLYFGHHHGLYIRLAWSERVAGPFYLVDREVGKSAFTLGELDSGKKDIRRVLSEEISMRGHVSSPIVVVDHEKRLFKMYCHAYGVWNRTNEKLGQKTFWATSSDGLSFHESIAPVMLGISYFSPFQVRGRWYAFANGGWLYEAPASGETVVPLGFDYRNDLWQVRKDFFGEALESYSRQKGEKLFGVRHVGQFVEGTTVYAFFSSRKDTPERIYCAKIDAGDPDFRRWNVSDLTLVMQAEREWEGGDIPVKESVGGSAKEPLNEVRDPFVFCDRDGKRYLLYCAGGERAIGIASLEIKD